MNKKVLLSTRVALLSVLLLSGHTAAYGQKAPNRQNPLLPDVHLGLNKLGVDAVLTPLAAPKAVLPILPSLSVPGVAIRVAPPIGGLTPPLGTNVNVNTGGSGSLVSVGVDISGSALQLDVADGTPGAPLIQNVNGPNLIAAQGGGHMAERSLDQVPTCR